ncbi:MAG: hypothetical protein ACU84J_00745 [Gammaproteobacteria bacterium]
MNNNNSPLDQWLSEYGQGTSAGPETWDPGFDGDRQIVIAKFGPFQKIYQRPSRFTRRFYHRVYPLPIEDWQIFSSFQLYGGLCTIDTRLTVRFQASTEYAAMHVDSLPDINRQIKAGTEIVIRDAVEQEFLLLDDGAWIELGLPQVEKRIQNRINEALIMQHIQCRATCELHPSFKDIKEEFASDNPFVREDIFLKVMKKNHEFQERQNKARFEREQELEKRRLEQQRTSMEQRQREEELKRTEQALSAESARRSLEERERQLAEQLAIEERLHVEQIKHQARLKELEQEAMREAELRQHAKQLEIEEQLQEEKLKHQQMLKERERDAEIKDFEEMQTKWKAAKERMEIEKIEQEKRLKELETEGELRLEEIKLLEKQKLEEKLHQEKLKHESRIREMELELKVEEQKKRYEATKESDEHLRRDIELLILEKQRSELLNAVKKVRSEEPPSTPHLPAVSESDSE